MVDEQVLLLRCGCNYPGGEDRISLVAKLAASEIFFGIRIGLSER
jgi:sialic acid synthase SpsE